jgi:peptidyl-prolyl cis-trans isomerase C
MEFKNGSLLTGTRLATCSLLAVGLLSAQIASAETIFTVNGVDVDSTVVDLYFNSRLGNQGGQATPEQREILMAELRDIYILATQDNAESLAQQDHIAAQLDLQRRSILAQAVATEILSGIAVSEEELQAEYAEQVRLAPPLQFKARHILVESQGEAVDLISQLDDGADFQELAQEHSTGPSGPNGGDLGWFSPNQMVQPFSEAVQAMEDGQHSAQPVQTQFGWHVILREESRESEPPTFESARENLNVAIQQRKFQERLDELRAAAAEPATE